MAQISSKLAEHLQQAETAADDASRDSHLRDALRICESTLRQPNVDAAVAAVVRRCRAVALLRLERYDEAAKATASDAALLREHAYALYRLGKYRVARDELAAAGDEGDDEVDVVGRKVCVF